MLQKDPFKTVYKKENPPVSKAPVQTKQESTKQSNEWFREQPASYEVTYVGLYSKI